MISNSDPRKTRKVSVDLLGYVRMGVDGHVAVELGDGVSEDELDACVSDIAAFCNEWLDASDNEEDPDNVDEYEIYATDELDEDRQPICIVMRDDTGNLIVKPKDAKPDQGE